MTSPNISFTITASDTTKEAFTSVNKGLADLQGKSDKFAQSGGVSAGLIGGATNQLRNASYQITDFIVQVQGGQKVSLALSQQLPQLLAGFGALGAALGVAAALLPPIISGFLAAADGGKKLDEALSDLNSAVGDVGKTSREFTMDKLYEEFNKANGVVRTGIIEQVKFQAAMIETQKIIAQGSLSKTLEDFGKYSFLDKMKGAFADTGAEKLAKDLGISNDLASQMLPSIKGMRDGTEDASNFMANFGVSLAKSTNVNAQQLVKDLKSVADSGKDAAAAQSRLSEALQKMGKAGNTGQIAIDNKKAKAGKLSSPEASPEALAYGKAMESLAKLTDDANASQLDLSKSQRALLDLMSLPQWADMPETWKKTAVAQFESAQAAELAANSHKRLNDMLGATDSSKLDAARKDMELLAAALEKGTISADQFSEAATARLDLMGKKAEEATNQLDEFARAAAHNMQSALADFLFDPFAQGADGMVKKFGETLQRMAANAAAAQIGKYLFGDLGSGGKTADAGAIGSLAAGAGNWLSSINWSSLFSFDGGGSTGPGARTGGVDGKGGFPALLHPNETVVDHTKGQRMSGGNNIAIYVNSQTGDSAEIRRSSAAGARTALGFMGGAQRYA